MGRSCGTFKHAVAKNPTVKTAPTINKIWLKNIEVSRGKCLRGKDLLPEDKSRSGANRARQIAKNFLSNCANRFEATPTPLGMRFFRELLMVLDCRCQQKVAFHDTERKKVCLLASTLTRYHSDGSVIKNVTIGLDQVVFTSFKKRPNRYKTCSFTAG